MVLINQLNEIGKRIKHCFPRINGGGCCVYAVLIAKELQKLKIPVNIIVAGENGKNNVAKARRAVKVVDDHVEWHRQGIFFNHVGLEFTYGRRRYHYDVNGVVPKGNELLGYPVYPGHLKVPLVELIAAQPHVWNAWFDRKQIPKIAKKIQNFFNPACRVYKQFMKTLETKVEIVGKRISDAVNAIVSTKGLRIHSDKLRHGGRSVKWSGLVVSEAKRKKIEAVVKKMYPGYYIEVYQSVTQHNSAHDGLRVRISNKV